MMHDWVRRVEDRPARWAGWYNCAVSAYAPELLAFDGHLPDLIGGDHGKRVDYTAQFPRLVLTNGRDYAANPVSGFGTMRWRGGYRNATAARLTSGNGITVWWYGVLSPQYTTFGSPRLVSLEYSDPEVSPYICGGAITREAHASGYLLNTWTTNAGTSQSVQVAAHTRPRLLVLVLYSGSWTYRQLWDDGVQVQEYNGGTLSSPITTGTTHLLMQGHTVLNDGWCLAGTIAAGYHTRMISPGEIKQWARNPLGPLMRTRRVVSAPSQRILRPVFDLANAGWSAP